VKSAQAMASKLVNSVSKSAPICQSSA
jgi:hypothetical protein